MAERGEVVLSGEDRAVLERWARRPDLVASIRTWATNWNENPKPYIWHKTPDEILTSHAAYCKRISDSGHQVAAFAPLPVAGKKPLDHPRPTKRGSNWLPCRPWRPTPRPKGCEWGFLPILRRTARVELPARPVARGDGADGGHAAQPHAPSRAAADPHRMSCRTPTAAPATTAAPAKATAPTRAMRRVKGGLGLTS